MRGRVRAVIISRARLSRYCSRVLEDTLPSGLNSVRPRIHRLFGGAGSRQLLSGYSTLMGDFRHMSRLIAGSFPDIGMGTGALPSSWRPSISLLGGTLRATYRPRFLQGFCKDRPRNWQGLLNVGFPISSVISMVVIDRILLKITQEDLKTITRPQQQISTRSQQI